MCDCFFNDVFPMLFRYFYYRVAYVCDRLLFFFVRDGRCEATIRATSVCVGAFSLCTSTFLFFYDNLFSMNASVRRAHARRTEVTSQCTIGTTWFVLDCVSFHGFRFGSASWNPYAVSSARNLANYVLFVTKCSLGGTKALLRSLKIPPFAKWRWGTLHLCCKQLKYILPPLRGNYHAFRTLVDKLKRRIRVEAGAYCTDWSDLVSAVSVRWLVQSGVLQGFGMGHVLQVPWRTIRKGREGRMQWEGPYVALGLGEGAGSNNQHAGRLQLVGCQHVGWSAYFFGRGAGCGACYLQQGFAKIWLSRWGSISVCTIGLRNWHTGQNGFSIQICATWTTQQNNAGDLRRLCRQPGIDGWAWPHTANFGHSATPNQEIELEWRNQPRPHMLFLAASRHVRAVRTFLGSRRPRASSKTSMTWEPLQHLLAFPCKYCGTVSKAFCKLEGTVIAINIYIWEVISGACVLLQARAGWRGRRWQRRWGGLGCESTRGMPTKLKKAQASRICCVLGCRWHNLSAIEHNL